MIFLEDTQGTQAASEGIQGSFLSGIFIFIAAARRAAFGSCPAAARRAKFEPPTAAVRRTAAARRAAVARRDAAGPRPSPRTSRS